MITETKELNINNELKMICRFTYVDYSFENVISNVLKIKILAVQKL